MSMTTSVTIPGLGLNVFFQDRQAMKLGHPSTLFGLKGSFPSVTAPIDWSKNNALSFPFYGNNLFNDCMYAAACHGDNTFTGNTGTEFTFDLTSLLFDYEKLSGGDNGLTTGQIVKGWKKGLARTPLAYINEALSLDPNDVAAMQAAIYFFGGVFFMLDVPDDWWKSYITDAVWDAPAKADGNHGHAVWWNGVDTFGRYKFQSWGTHGWITPAGVKVCDPSCFVVFSPRWFNSQGVAPNGYTYDQLAALWVQFGGQPLPYQNRILQIGTTFAAETDGTWLMADYDRDGTPDLVFIKTGKTPSGNVEVHIASGATKYQKRILEIPTTFASETDGTWLMANYDGTGFPDLVFIRTSNSTIGQVEVHVASGSSKYQTRTFESPTTFNDENDGVWLLSDYSKSKMTDLVFIKTSNVPKGFVEVHIATR